MNVEGAVMMVFLSVVSCLFGLWKIHNAVKLVSFHGLGWNDPRHNDEYAE